MVGKRSFSSMAALCAPSLVAKVVFVWPSTMIANPSSGRSCRRWCMIVEYPPYRGIRRESRGLVKRWSCLELHCLPHMRASVTVSLGSWRFWSDEEGLVRAPQSRGMDRLKPACAAFGACQRTADRAGDRRRRQVLYQNRAWGRSVALRLNRHGIYIAARSDRE